MTDKPIYEELEIQIAELKRQNVLLKKISDSKSKEADKYQKELRIASKTLDLQEAGKRKRADELIIANKELDFQNTEKRKRADELNIANKELDFQNQEKRKRADELIIANKELDFQNQEKGKRADELIIANKELDFQNQEKGKRADELIIAKKELDFQNDEKRKRADELIIAKEKLDFQNDEKRKRADELIIANQELDHQNEENEKGAAELVIANIEIAFQNEEKIKHAAKLISMNIKLALESEEIEKLENELAIANLALSLQEELIVVKEQVEETVNKLKFLFSTIPDLVSVKDQNGVYTNCNQRFEDYMGFPESDIVGKTDHDLLTKELALLYAELDNTAKTNGKPTMSEEQITFANDGHKEDLETIKTPIFSKENQIVGVLGIGRNITERKLAELLIQQKNHELNELVATKDKFFSIISHDLRNPFTAILSSCELLQMHAKKNDPEKIEKFATNIYNAVMQVNKLLENLMEWSRLQTGTIVPKYEKYNLKTIAYEICLLSSGIAENKNITIQNNITADVFLKCDVEMTKTVFRNLLTNAIKFTHKDGTVSINYLQDETTIIISISDTGVGIKSENIPFLFAIEKNVSTPGTNKERGTGLGLILSKELVEKQGGKIWVESEVDKGSDFKFALPVFSN